MVFGRRKDGQSQDEPDAAAEGASDGPPDVEDDAVPEHLPPIPSALGSGDRESDPGDESDPAPAGSSWAPVEPVDQGPAAAEPEAEAADGALPEADLPAWGGGPLNADEPAAAAGAIGEATPWGAPSSSEDQPSTFTPSLLDPHGGGAENLAWPQTDPEGAAPWGITPEAAEPEEATASPFASSAGELEEVEEIAAEAPLEEVEGAQGPGLDSFSEVVTVSGEPWSTPVPEVEEPSIYRTSQPEAAPARAEAPGHESRSFPLPEGEVVFRNLRAGFTDPARLLRHLAGEGHTGVLHVLGVDGGNSYVVLVDGYVVAVANDFQGTVTTTNRISFPNFPNSQDSINVISYSRQIARGLGLLLHAPVRFAGLGAMFVNLEGLRSYLSKYASSGGLIIHAHDGVGVALFEEGKLLGGYADSSAPTGDLGQLRDLVKDLEAEIDVRFGGPSELAPIPLDTLLSGYPL